LHIYFIAFKNGCQGNFLPLHQWIKFLQKIDHYCIMTPFFKCPPYEISGMRSAQTVDGWHSGDACHDAGAEGASAQARNSQAKGQRRFFPFFLEYRVISVFL
jgi:hypothetical protein